MPKIDDVITVIGHRMKDKGSGYECKGYEAKDTRSFTPETTLAEVLEWVTGDEAHEVFVLSSEYGELYNDMNKRRDGLFKIEIAIPEFKEVDSAKIKAAKFEREKADTERKEKLGDEIPF